MESVQSSTQQSSPGDDFPVVWENESDRLAFWVRDHEHNAGPVSHLQMSLGEGSDGAAAKVAARIGLPFARPETRHFNGYTYRRVIGEAAQSSEAREQQGRAEKKLERLARTVLKRWETRLMPQVVRDIEYMQGFDLQGVSMRELLAHLRRVLRIQSRHWEIHFITVFPLGQAFEKLVSAYSDCMGRRDEMAAYRLVQGLDNKTIEANRLLWRLSPEAKSSPAVATVFATAEASDILPELEKSEEGRGFMGQVRAFLDVHGYKSTGSEDPAQPTWREDPSFVLSMIKGYLAREGYDFEAEFRKLVEEREKLVAEVRAKVSGSAPKRRRFDAALALAQQTWPLREDHAFYIDQKSASLIRGVYLEFGRRFAAAHVLERPDDIFFLRLVEITDAARKLGQVDLRPLAAGRRQEWDLWLSMKPPRFLGTPPPRPPSRGTTQIVQTSADGRAILRGSPGSSGSIRGVARIIHSPADFGKLKPGEIMVCETTKPPWTPVFATIGGLVVDTGGALSHGAVVAREYRIPAVMGTRQGTRVIQDGQIVEVDGRSGLVYLDSES